MVVVEALESIYCCCCCCPMLCSSIRLSRSFPMRGCKRFHLLFALTRGLSILSKYENLSISSGKLVFLTWVQ